MSRVIVAFLLLFSAANMFSQGLDCNTATPYCDAPGGVPVSFPNNTNNSSEAGPNYGCLTTHPNPAWFYFKTTTAGNYTFDLGQGSSCGTTNLDVDFICWGPFTNPLTACNNLTAGNTVDCSYSASAVEQINVNGAPAGQYYIVLITNYANAAGCVQFGLTASSPPTDCSITCASVLSGPGIVSFPSSNPLAGTPATPMPASVACNSGLQNMYATNLSPFGNPITPGVMITFPNNANVNNSVSWYEAGSLIGCFGPSAGCLNLTPSYNEQLQFSYMSPSAVNQFSFCESNTAQPNMATNVKDLAGGANMPGAPFTWVDDGACQTINIPAGTIRGISTWTASCGACLSAVTDWGAAQFNPAAAALGSNTITYSYNSQQAGCTTYTTSIIINVTNPYNAAFVVPGPFCAGAACASFTPSNTYTVGTGTFAGTGVSGNTFCPATSGVGSFPVTYTIGVSPTCRASVTNTVTVNAIPVANAGSAAVLTCANTSTTLSGSGGGSYSWSGTGITGGGNTATPTVNQAGTFTVLVTVGTCTSSATVAVTQNTTAPITTASSTGSITCATNTINLTSTLAGSNYTWTAPGGSSITSGTNSQNAVGQGAGTYTVRVQSTVNGCTTTAVTTVNTNTTSPITTASNSGSITCATNTINLTSTLAGANYTWTAPSGSSISSGTNSQNAVGSGNGTYTLTVQNAVNGCTTSVVTSAITNTTAPATTASTAGSITCSTNTINLNSTLAGANYTWTAPSGSSITSGTNSQNAIGNGTGTYTLTIQSAVNGCSNIAVTTANTNTTLPITTASNTGSITCTTNTINLTSTLAGVNYTWTAPGGSSISSGTNSQNAVGQGLGTYTVTVQNPINGCTSTAITSALQNTTTPTVTMPSTQTITCATPSVSLIGSANPSTCTPVWTGGACGGAGTYTAAACSPNTYTLTVTNPINGCSTSGTVNVVPSLGIPSVTLSNTGTITCVNTSAQVSASTTMTPVSYAWSGPSAVIGASTPNGTVSLGGTYQCVVTNTITGCTSTITTVVPTNTTAVAANITAPALITCTNNTITLTATPTGTNYTYSWSGPGTIVNGTTSAAIVNASGNYVVTITDNINGCIGSFTTTVSSNTTAPTFTLGSASSVTTTCAAPTATLSATSSTDPNTIYTWTTPSSSTITGSPIFVSATGIYTVVVTNTVNGCSTSSALSQATVEVIADSGIPVVTLAANSLSITCTNPTPSVAVTTTASPVSYNWTPTIGIVPGTETTANPVFNAAGSYSVTVTNTVSSCATSINANVVTVTLDNTIPTISLSTATNDGTITCTSTLVTVTPTITPSANLTYTWTGGTGISTPINQSSATFTSSGVYTLAVTNTLTGCVSSSTNTSNTFTVTTDNVSPTASISAISSNSVIGCGGSGSTVTLGSFVTSSNTHIITWLPSTATPTLDVTIAGVYTLVVVDAINGCSVTAQYTVNGSTTPPQNVDAGTNASIACGNSTITLNGVTTSTNVNYSWTGPSATSILSGSTTLNPTVGETGSYVLTVTDNATGCLSTATVIVTQAVATASITANPTTGLSPLTVDFTGNGVGAPTFSWDFGNSATSTTQNPTNVFNTGTYTVVLTTTSGTCTATASVVIVVEDGLTLEIPNVFTPNDDKSNDVFTIKSTGVKEISLQIFNRWGQSLYEFAGPKASWDGNTAQGQSVPGGTYFYFVKATGFDGKIIEKNGTVNLFR